MKNGKVTLLAVATIATATLGIKGAYADESNSEVTNDNTTITVGTENARVEEEGAIPRQVRTEREDPQSGESNPTDTNATSERGIAPTTFEKDGDQIRVENPEVVVDQSNGNGKYQSFTVEYKDVHFPDNMEINEGDKVTFTLPEEVTFQTNFTFDVHNPENAVVGQATADSKAGTVTTVFNDYFKNHPLNKQMSLKLDAKWTDKVQSGQPVSANFNGTVVTAQIGKEQEIGSDELISKWGSQDKDDPTVINWTIRINYARKVLNYVKIIDEMSDNQKLIDDYLVVNYVDSVTPWIDKGSALDLIKSMSKSEHGFEITMDRLDRMIYVWYKTKLTNAVKDSTNPTNKVELKAETDGAISTSRVQLVGGRGDASGENKPDPVFELPNEAPIVDLPEWKGGTVPFDAPKHDKPEFEGGVVPNEAPILELPELHIPESPEKPSKPQNDKPKENIKPQDKTPKIEREAVKITHEGERVEEYAAPAQLPETGSDFGVAISLFGLSCLMVGSWLKKED